MPTNDRWKPLTDKDFLSCGETSHIADDIRHGVANPEDAKRLLTAFCDLFDQRRPIPEELLEYLRDAFSSFLKGEKKIEVALGLKRRRGTPNADYQVRAKMAAEVLRKRLKGVAHQQALEEVAESFGWGKTIIGEAWASHRSDAIALLDLERPGDEYPWTPEEVERMCEIFSDQPWFIAPEKPKDKPA